LYADTLIHRPYRVFGIVFVLKIDETEQLIDSADYDVCIGLLRVDSGDMKRFAGVVVEMLQFHRADFLVSEFVSHNYHLDRILIDKQKKIK